MDLSETLLKLDSTVGLTVAAVAGLLSATIVILVGQSLGRRRPQGPPPELVARASAKGPDPAHDPFVQGSACERRRAPRRRGGGIEVHISDAEGNAEPVLGRVVDRSLEGICLAIEEPVPVGTILGIRPASHRSGGWVQVEVRRCQAEDGGYELGCRYVQTPSWNVRMLFG